MHIDVPSARPCSAHSALSFFLGYFVGFFLNFLLNCIAFWTLEIHAMQLIVTWVTDLLGGEVVPLLFFPPVVQRFIFALPFAAMYSTPLLIYVGTIGPEHYLRGHASASAVDRGASAIVAALVWRAGATPRRGAGRMIRAIWADVYGQYWRINLLTALEYRANFLVWFGFTFIYHGDGDRRALGHACEISVMNGWDFRQMAFLYGLWMLAHALNNTLFYGRRRPRTRPRRRVRPVPRSAARRALSSDHDAAAIFPDELLLAILLFIIATIVGQSRSSTVVRRASSRSSSSAAR